MCYNLLVVPKLHTPPCAPLDARDFYSKQRGRGLNPTSPFFSFCHVHSCVNQQPNRDTWPHVVHESIQTNTLTLSKPKLWPAQVWPGAGAAPCGCFVSLLVQGCSQYYITQRFRIDCWACQARGAASVCLRSGVSSCPRRPIQPTHRLTGISLHTCHRQVKTDRCEKHAGRNTPRASNHQPATRGWACQEASYRVVYHNGQYSIQRGPWSAHGGIQVTNGDLVENKTHLT